MAVVLLAARLLGLDGAVVARLADRLEVRRITEQVGVALVGLTVVDDGGADDEALGPAALADRLALKLGLAERSPLGCLVELPVCRSFWAALVGTHGLVVVHRGVELRRGKDGDGQFSERTKADQGCAHDQNGALDVERSHQFGTASG